MCLYFYIHNKYTQYTYISEADVYNVNFSGDAINRLTALMIIYRHRLLAKMS